MLDLNGVWFCEWHSSLASRSGWRCFIGWSTSGGVVLFFNGLACSKFVMSCIDIRE